MSKVAVAVVAVVAVVAAVAFLQPELIIGGSGFISSELGLDGVGAMLSASSFVGALTGASGVGAAFSAWGSVIAISGALSALAFGMPAPKSYGGQLSQTLDPQAGIPILFGRSATGGNVVYRETWGKNNRYASLVNVVSAGPIAGYDYFQCEDFLVTWGGDPTNNLVGSTAISPNGGNTSMFVSRMRQEWRLGTTSEATLQTGALADPNMTADSKLSGLAHVLHVYDYNQAAFPNLTIPTGIWVARGVMCYDPRKDSTYPGGSGTQRATNPATWAYSENPFICGLTWALGIWDNGQRVAGVGATVDQIDVASFVSAANVADANLWTCGGVASTTDDKFTVLNSILQAGSGQAVVRNGLLSCFVNAPLTSLYTVTTADVVGAMDVQNTTAWRDRKNRAIPQYREETQFWQVIAGDLVSPTEYLTEDNGVYKTIEQVYAYVQNATAATQLASYDLANSREFLTFDIICKPHMTGFEVGQSLTLNIPEIGANNQQCLIIGKEFDTSTWQVTLKLRSETTAKHAFALGLTAIAPPSPSLSVPLNEAPGPSAWNITDENYTGTDGSVVPALVINGASDDSLAQNVLFEFQVAGAGAWTLASKGPAATTTQSVITSVTAGTQYYVAVSYESVRGVVGDRLILGPVIAGQSVSSYVANLPITVGGNSTTYVSNTGYGGTLNLAGGLATDGNGNLLANNISYNSGNAVQSVQAAIDAVSNGLATVNLVLANSAAGAANSIAAAANAIGAAANVATYVANTFAAANAVLLAANASYTLATAYIANADVAANNAVGLAVNAASNASTFSANARTYANTAVGASTTANSASTAAVAAQGLAVAASNTANTAAANSAISATQAITASNNANSASSTASTQAGIATGAATNANTAATTAILEASYSTSNATLAAANATAAHTSMIQAVANAAASQASAAASQTSATQAQSNATAAGSSASLAASEASQAQANAVIAQAYSSSAQSASNTANAAQAASAISAGTAVGASGTANTAAAAASTSAGSASGFASTAAGSASTATTQAGVATAAGTAATTGAAASFPSNFAQLGQFFTLSVGSGLNNLSGIAASSNVSYPTVGGYGTVLQTAGISYYIATQGYVTLTAGHTYSLTMQTLIVADSTNNSGGYQAQYMGFAGYNSVGTYLGICWVYAPTQTASMGWQTWNCSATTAQILATSGLSTAVYIRPVIIQNWISASGNNGNGTTQTALFLFADTTAQVAAAASAAASASSATTASSAATTAGSYATVATNQATTATTAAGTATTQAGSAATSASGAAGSAVSANNYAQLSATTSGVLNRNSTFISYLMNGIPPGWGDWSSGASGLVETGLNGYGSAYRASVAAAGSQGLAQGVTLSLLGWYVLEATVGLDSGDWVGAGVYFDYCSSPMGFATDPDITGTVSSTATGIRSYSKLVQANNGGNQNVYLMTGWEGGGFGAVTAKTIDWYRCSIRPASAAEIAVGKVGTSPTSLTSAISTAANTYATPLSTATTNITNLTSRLNAGTNVNILANPSFQQVFNSWTNYYGNIGVYAGFGSACYYYPGTGTQSYSYRDIVRSYSFSVNTGYAYSFQFTTYSGGAGGNSSSFHRMVIDWFNSSGGLISSQIIWQTNVSQGWAHRVCDSNNIDGSYLTAPAGAITAQIYMDIAASTGNYVVANSDGLIVGNIKVEQGVWATPISDSQLAATVQTQAGTIATLQGQSAYYLIDVGTTGGQAQLAITSSSGGGTAIQLQAGHVGFGPNGYFDETNNTLEFTNGTLKTVYGQNFGASANLMQWFGSASTATASTTIANSNWALASDGNVYHGGSALSSAKTSGTLSNTSALATLDNSSWQTYGTCAFSSILAGSYWNTVAGLFTASTNAIPSSGTSATFAWRIVEAPHGSTSYSVVASGSTPGQFVSGEGWGFPNSTNINDLYQFSGGPAVACVNSGAVDLSLQLYMTGTPSTITNIRGTVSGQWGAGG